MNVSFAPLAEDDPLRPAVERAERALRESIAESMHRRDEILLGLGLAGCACQDSKMREASDHLNHTRSYEHLLAGIYSTVYVKAWPIPADKILDALRPRAALLSAEVAEAVEAIIDAKEPDALALAFRLVAQSAVILKGGR